MQRPTHMRHDTLAAAPRSSVPLGYGRRLDIHGSLCTSSKLLIRNWACRMWCAHGCVLCVPRCAPPPQPLSAPMRAQLLLCSILHGKDHKAPRASPVVFSSLTLRDFARTHLAHAGASCGGRIAWFRPHTHYLNLDILPKMRHIWHTVGGSTLIARA